MLVLCCLFFLVARQHRKCVGSHLGFGGGHFEFFTEVTYWLAWSSFIGGLFPQKKKVVPQLLKKK